MWAGGEKQDCKKEPGIWDTKAREELEDGTGGEPRKNFVTEKRIGVLPGWGSAFLNREAEIGWRGEAECEVGYVTIR